MLFKHRFFVFTALCVVCMHHRSYSVFESHFLSGLQVGAGTVPFTFKMRSLGSLRDPAALIINKDYFLAGSYSRKFGLEELPEYAFIFGSPSGNIGWGIGGTFFGNNLYKESQLCFLASSTFSKKIHVGLGLNYYSLDISNYGHAGTFGMNISCRYYLTEPLESAILLQNVNSPVIGQVKEKLPRVISMGIISHAINNITAQVAYQQDTDFNGQVKTGVVW